MLNDSTKEKNSLSNMALYLLLGPFYVGPLFTPSWPLLLRPLLHLLGPFYFDPFYTFLAPFTADPSAHSWPSTTALCKPWPLYHGPFYTLAPLSRPLLHLLGHSTMAPFYNSLVPSSTTPSTLSWPLYCGTLLHITM